MDQSSLISRNKEIIHNYLDDDVVMMNIDKGQYYRLNAVGTKIWTLLEEGAVSVDALADKLLPEFSVSKEILVADIIAFAQKSSEQGLISITE